MLPALILAVSLGAAGDARPAATAGPGPGPRIEVERGLALVRRTDGDRELVPADGPVDAAPAGRIELRAASRLRLAWEGSATLAIDGPAVLEWASPTRAESGPSLRLVSLRGAEVEVRSGAPLRIELPQAFEITASRAAFALDGLPGGGIELRHHAGQDLSLKSLAKRRSGTWPARVRAGERQRLVPAAAA